MVMRKLSLAVFNPKVISRTQMKHNENLVLSFSC